MDLVDHCAFVQSQGKKMTQVPWAVTDKRSRQVPFPSLPKEPKHLLDLRGKAAAFSADEVGRRVFNKETLGQRIRGHTAHGVPGKRVREPGSSCPVNLRFPISAF